MEPIKNKKIENKIFSVV